MKKSLIFHNKPKPGKIFIKTKKIKNIKDISLAYSPGVADASLKIVKNNKNVFKYTNKGNLVGVLTNGTAVLGLGNIGSLASKPVMEGKAMLFKKFAGIDSFDIEINERNPKKLVKIICSLENTFGGINLEDIKSPECFYVEKLCKKKLNIPVFHDDQHGTAVVVCAALINALRINRKKIYKIKTVVTGAGAASIACLNLLYKIGMKLKNIKVFDLKGILYKKRKDIEKNKRKFISNKFSTLKKEIKNADFFLGLSSSNILSKENIMSMSKNPIIFALSNPNPEISPFVVKKNRPDAIMATGRSDFPNQVNNALCFPYIFRAVLDMRCKKINDKIKLSAVKALSHLGYISKKFDKNHLLPSIMSKKLIEYVPLKIIKENYNKKFNFKKYKIFLKNICQ
ncbi:malic enzyme-like NAD(P)-binding protein [Candidatus Vidania fulgoroideorum]